MTSTPPNATTQRKLAENDVNLDLLREKLGDKISGVAVDFGQVVIKAPRENRVEVLTILRDTPELAFNMLTDITAVDNLRREDFEPARRFTVITILYSMTHHKRVRLECDVPEQDPTCPSAAGVYKGGTWIEREVFDMFGIRFGGHPDLRRVLTPDYFTDHVLRKDYPLAGKGERDNFVRAEELD